MAVRLKPVPLKRSSSVGVPPNFFSISTVRSIMASVCWEFCGDLLPRHWIERRASCLRLRRISHHEDSGAMKMSINRGVWSSQYWSAPHLKKETYGKDPLQRKRYSPRPLVVSLVIVKSGGGDNDWADGPGHLKCSCASTSKGEGNNCASTGGSIRNEKSPRNTFQGLSDDKQGKRIGPCEYS